MTLDEAKNRLNCGSNKELALKLNISEAAISKWNNQKIPQLREYQVLEKCRQIGITNEQTLVS